MDEACHTLPSSLQEGKVRDDLITSSQKISNWRGDVLSKYEGFWYWEDKWQAVLSYRKHFRVRDSDILLASLPKSDTTWVKAMMYVIVNKLTSSPSVKTLFFPFEVMNTLFRKYKTCLQLIHPLLSLGDEVMNSSCKIIIYICRNPKDNLISLWHFLDQLRPVGYALSINDAFDKFCEGDTIFGPYWDHVLGHWKASLEMPEKVMFLTYERVKEQPDHYLKEMAEFMGCPFSALEESEGVVDGIVKLCSFGHLSQLEVNKSGN